MIYTSGIVSTLEEEESLEKLQDNKLSVVCEKVRCPSRPLHTASLLYPSLTSSLKTVFSTLAVAGVLSLRSPPRTTTAPPSPVSPSHAIRLSLATSASQAM